MILRLAFFALMALGLVGFGTVAWISTRPPTPDPATVAAAARVTVLSAAHPVRAGTLLKPEDLAAKQITVGEAGDDSSLDTQDARHALAGAMVQHSLDVGDVVRMKDVMRPGDHGFLAAVLGPGMRAVSVGVDAITGSAGLIWPGDRVDLILTQAIGDASVPVGHRIAAETVLSGVRVIAIDQQLVQGVAPDGRESPHCYDGGHAHSGRACGCCYADWPAFARCTICWRRARNDDDRDKNDLGQRRLPRARH
jgi:pilus assembly protein CpaB